MIHVNIINISTRLAHGATWGLINNSLLVHPSLYTRPHFGDITNDDDEAATAAAIHAHAGTVTAARAYTRCCCCRLFGNHAGALGTGVGSYMEGPSHTPVPS